MKEYLVQEFPCGCRIVNFEDGSCGINYCSKHKAASYMYEALKAQHQAIDLLFAMLILRDKTFFPSKSGQPWEAIIEGNKALAKAEGR